MKPNDNREHWSASSLRELCSCPLRYRLHRIDRVRASHRSPSLVLGGIYHQVLANALTALRDGEPVKKDGLVRQFKFFWKTELEAGGPPIKWTAKVTAENQRELGIEMVKAWHDQGLPL
ncbi:MAG: PD-(D/E)XK nuclease family protein, partial [Planctomycetota bacterium]